MDERLRFVGRLLDGETMAVLCRESDISRKTAIPAEKCAKHLRTAGTVRVAAEAKFRLTEMLRYGCEACTHGSWAAPRPLQYRHGIMTLLGQINVLCIWMQPQLRNSDSMPP